MINRYVGNLPPMPGVFPDYPAPVVRNAGAERELTMMRWGMPPPPRTGGRSNTLSSRSVLAWSNRPRSMRFNGMRPDAALPKELK